MTKKKREPWDGLPHGWLKDDIEKNHVKAKVTDPEERKAIFERETPELRLGPGARTIPRRGRGYYPRGY